MSRRNKAPEFNVPQPPPTADAAGSVDERALPSDLTVAFALLQEAENMPTRNPSEVRARETRLRQIRSHVFQLQQGVPRIVVDANGYAASAKRHAEVLKEQRLELMAREHPEVRELLAELAKLKAKAK